MSKPNETMQPEAVETGTRKPDVTVPLLRRRESDRPCQCTFNDSFVVEGFRICTGDKGIYINMPSAKDSQGNWRDTFKPITAEARRQLTEAIAEGYGIAMEKMQATLGASRNATEKPSLTGALKENAEKVKAQPAKSAGKNEQSL
ncbi:MAG: septation protein SpoVG family protein [Eubacterium callanderi]|uniref:septation protein SpoVG family protein n=1 Tax=Eubacterium callanderi TaxID=53442 RepID=UPI003996110E